MSAEEDPSASLFTQDFNSSFQPLLIAIRLAPWRAKRALLPKRQITAQHPKSQVAESFREADEQWRSTVRTGAVGQDDSVSRI